MRTYVITPRYESYTESKIIAREGAFGSPFGAGICRTTLLEQLLDARPVLPLTRSTSSACRRSGSRAPSRTSPGLRPAVDLVQHRDDVQIVLQSQVQVRERLRLDPARHPPGRIAAFAPASELLTS
jgi:hypothetical protein